jgi:hypothetical protein
MAYEVIENAGRDNETVVETFATHATALAYIDDMYDEDEIDKLAVDVTHNRSTEY